MKRDYNPVRPDWALEAWTAEEWAEEQKERELIDMAIDRFKELGMSTRLANVLAHNECFTIHQTFCRSDREWLRVGNLGRKSLNELKLHQETYYGGYQGGDEDWW